ncbi:MAG: thiamine pyrophosphate-binding protein [Bryobacterales bacterium]
MAEVPSCADVLAQSLHSFGVRYVFGHPGGETIDVIQALESHGVSFILTGHESGAAFMAGAVGRLTGTPGVCLSTLGPGACNLVIGVSSAHLDRDPMIALSARSASGRCQLSAKQNLPLNQMFELITKQSVLLDGANTAETLKQAMDLARTPPRGPVFLSLPSDVAAAPERNEAAAARAAAPLNDSGDGFEVIQRALNGASRPIGVVGIALDAERDCQAVRRFFQETGIAYVSMPQAKGVADEGGEGYLGTVGAGAGDEFIADCLNRSDCLLGVGFDPVESSDDWHIRRPLYSIANSSIRFREYSPTAECIGDVGELLESLRSAYSGRSSWQAAEIQQIRQRTMALLCSQAQYGDEGLSPFHLVRALREALPREAIVTADVGAHKMLLTQTWHTYEPGTFLISNGLSAMGYGVPAAIAAALVHPDRPVAGIVGDGGFAMMVQELETIRRLGVSPLIVVFCDRSLAIIKLAQQASGRPHVGVDFCPVGGAKVAGGLGVRGLTPDTLEGVQAAVEDWRSHREPTVLAVPVDPSLYSGLTY